MQLKELENDGSQSVLRRAFAREIFGEVHAIWTPSCAEIRSTRADTSIWKIKKFKRRWDCSQNQSWRVADHVTRMEKLWRFLSWLRSIKYWSRCWIWTPDSITSDRIWCWYRNAWLLNQRNSPPGNYDPRNHLQRTLADIMIQADRKTISSR